MNKFNIQHTKNRIFSELWQLHLQFNYYNIFRLIGRFCEEIYGRANLHENPGFYYKFIVKNYKDK